MTKIFETTAYESPSTGAIFSYSSVDQANNGTIQILESFNEGTVLDWLLKGSVGELFEEIGETEFLLLLRSQASDASYSSMKMKSLSIKEIRDYIVKRAEAEGYSYSDGDVEDNLEALSEIISKYPSPFFFCSVENAGWRKQSGHKFTKLTSGRDFINNILPKTENSFSIFSEDENTLKVVNCHHDSPTGETYYLKNMTLDVMISLYENSHDIATILENSVFSELEKPGHERFLLIAMEKDDSDAVYELLKYGVSFESDQGYKNLMETAFDNESLNALETFFNNATNAVKPELIKQAIVRNSNESIHDLILNQGVDLD